VSRVVVLIGTSTSVLRNSTAISASRMRRDRRAGEPGADHRPHRSADDHDRRGRQPVVHDRAGEVAAFDGDAHPEDDQAGRGRPDALDGVGEDPGVGGGDVQDLGEDRERDRAAAFARAAADERAEGHRHRDGPLAAQRFEGLRAAEQEPAGPDHRGQRELDPYHGARRSEPGGGLVEFEERHALTVPVRRRENQSLPRKERSGREGDQPAVPCSPRAESRSSRALATRDRTVPMGQSQISAASA
jgi:hypothetical protein